MSSSQPAAVSVDATEVIMQATEEFRHLLAQEAQHQRGSATAAANDPSQDEPSQPRAHAATTAPQSRPRTSSAPTVNMTAQDLGIDHEETGGSNKRRRTNTFGESAATARTSGPRVHAVQVASALMPATRDRNQLPRRIASPIQVGNEADLSIPIDMLVQRNVQLYPQITPVTVRPTAAAKQPRLTSNVSIHPRTNAALVDNPSTPSNRSANPFVEAAPWTAPSLAYSYPLPLPIPITPPPPPTAPQLNHQQQQQTHPNPSMPTSYFIPIGRVSMHRLIASHTPMTPPPYPPTNYSIPAGNSSMTQPAGSLSTAAQVLPSGFTSLGRHKVMMQAGPASLTTPATTAMAVAGDEIRAKPTRVANAQPCEPQRWALADALGVGVSGAPVLSMGEHHPFVGAQTPEPDGDLSLRPLSVAARESDSNCMGLGAALVHEQTTGEVSDGGRLNACGFGSTLAEAIGVRPGLPQTKAETKHASSAMAFECD
ncbi:hypothetical protein BCR44DRAFT_1424152 [Catenaria anguillulae PL171]|uniref:Uncharacterized protein n=1 Tax=Catenaria anguillulae PL171 TaxID=765915 RepID=A0A1Y2I299_9FUNG|nr:hypothetical protein BCR44DRAFT_1424152 [Catenaria anguillulae PL171]